MIAEAAKLVLRDSIEMRPGRDIEKYIEELLTNVLGVY